MYIHLYTHMPSTMKNNVNGFSYLVKKQVQRLKKDIEGNEAIRRLNKTQGEQLHSQR